MIEFHPLRPDEDLMPEWNPTGLKNLAKLGGLIVLAVAGVVVVTSTAVALSLDLIMP